jgi:hypothetical protein
MVIFAASEWLAAQLAGFPRINNAVGGGGCICELKQ